MTIQNNPPLSPSLNLQSNKSVWGPRLALALPYLGIIALMLFAEAVGSWSIRILVLPLVAILQNYLQVLQHEGAHFQLHPCRRQNDFLADVFCSIPFGGFVRHYRHFHFLHHRHLLDSERDPEVEFYREQGYQFCSMSRRRWLGILWKDLCGFHYIQFFISYHRYLISEMAANRTKRLSRAEIFAAFLVGMVSLVLLLFWPFQFVFYWVLPQVTWMFFLMKQQGYREHPERRGGIEESTFAHEGAGLWRVFIFPLNSHLHLEHHLYPSVPWYRLPELRKVRKRGHHLSTGERRT